MAQLPAEIYDELIDVLADLDEFKNNDTLRELFLEVNPKWKNNVQDTANSREERVKANLNWILTHRQSSNPFNEGIVLLLEKLLEKRVPDPPPYEKDSNRINYEEIDDPYFHRLNKLYRATKNHFEEKEQERLAKLQAEEEEKRVRENNLKFIANCLEQLEEEDIIILCYDYYPKAYDFLTNTKTDKKKILKNQLIDLAKKDSNQLTQLVVLLEQYSKFSKKVDFRNNESLEGGCAFGCLFLIIVLCVLFGVILFSQSNELISSNSFSKFQQCSHNCSNQSLPRLTLKTGENIEGINFNNTNLSEATLKGVNLSQAYLQGANLRCADLSGANLVGAKLDLANLNGANLTEANLTNAALKGVYYDDNTKWPSNFDPKAAGAIKQSIDNTCKLPLKAPTSPQ